MRNRKGFTLVELVIVIAVLAILAAIAIPSVKGILESGRESTAKENIRQVESAFKVALVEAESTEMDNVVSESQEFYYPFKEYTAFDRYVIEKMEAQVGKETLEKSSIFWSRKTKDLYITYYPNGRGVKPYYTYVNGEFEKVT